MRITEIPFPVLRLQYRIAREPLELIDKRFVSRMDSEAPARLLYERSVGALDAAVGNVLREVKLRRAQRDVGPRGAGRCRHPQERTGSGIPGRRGKAEAKRGERGRRVVTR